MKRFLHAIDTLNNKVGVGICYLLLVIISITIFEVINRFAFNNPTIWVYETTTQIFGLYLITSGGYALLHNAHIRIDVFWRLLSPRGKAVADAATCGYSFLFISIALWFSIRMAWISTLARERSSTAFNPYLFPLTWVLVLGMILMLLQLIVKAIRDFRLAIKGVEDCSTSALE